VRLLLEVLVVRGLVRRLLSRPDFTWRIRICLSTGRSTENETVCMVLSCLRGMFDSGRCGS
jgi:hypothetical protein